MTGLDLTPAGAAAARPARIWRHALIETRLIIRNGEQLLLALVIPVGLIIAGVSVGDRLGIAREPFIASVIALGLWSSGFTSPAITTAFERRYGVLERLVATSDWRTSSTCWARPEASLFPWPPSPPGASHCSPSCPRQPSQKHCGPGPARRRWDPSRAGRLS